MAKKPLSEQESLTRVVRWAFLLFIAYILFTGGYKNQPAGHSQESQDTAPTAAATASGGKAAAAPTEKNCATQDNFSSFASVASSFMPTVVPIIKTETVKDGTGEAAVCGQHAELHYEYRTDNGTLIVSDYDRAPLRVTIGDGNLMRAMEMGLQGLKIGGERRVKFPPALGFGRVNDLSRVPDIDKFAVKPADFKDSILIGKMSLLSLSPKAPESQQPLRIIDRKFTGGTHVTCGDTVSVRLTVWKLDGTKLFSTDDNAKVLVFTVGGSEVPYGIEQAVTGMGEDAERTAIIPAALTQPLNKNINWPAQPTLLSFTWPKETVIAEIYLSHIGPVPLSTTAIPMPGLPAMPEMKPAQPTPAPSSKPVPAAKGDAQDKDDDDDDTTSTSKP